MKLSTKKTIDLPKIVLHLVEEGLVLGKPKNNIVLEIEDIQEIDQLIYDKLVFGNPFVVIIDARDVDSTVSREAREFLSKNELVLPIRKAQAIVVNNLHTKLLANFYMKFHKPINPIKVFSDYASAYQWIKPIRDEWYS
ncbi:MAG: hypothetical protein J5I47_12610 [Vicingus serpentipes]|nr:hypothetical protein [Vicingus serpentipes]